MFTAPGRTDDLDAVVALVVAEQARPERRCTYVGVQAAGVRAELEALAPPWAETLRVVRDERGAIAGATVIEWDEELGRAWILGPWVTGDAVAWDEAAGPLLDAATAQAPPGVTRFELSGETANELLGELAAERGWKASEVSHALVVDEATVAGWPDDDLTIPIRDAVAGDETAIAGMHDAEFPGTYATAGQLVAGGEGRVVLVVPSVHADPAILAGYGAGEVHADGEGFIDFVAVHPDARGHGVGRRLVTALTRELLAASTSGQVALTVQHGREPARALYGQLGFRTDAEFVAYRNWES